jgi:hypothetical protein
MFRPKFLRTLGVKGKRVDRTIKICGLTKWDSFRTADWAELCVDPESVLTNTQQLLAITN